MNPLPRRFLCVITGENRCPVELASMALAGGADMIQLRKKNAAGRELFGWAIRIQELCREQGAVFIINDRVDIALAMQADGVHLGQNDLPVEAARSVLGPEAVIGISVSTLSEATSASRNGASYLGLGHIFPTGSKVKSGSSLGTETIRNIAGSVRLPVLAIGGITAENASEVILAGASGIAVIAAVSGAENPEKAARQLVRQIRQGRLP
jgi:thiamine-phosphate pyrophosphorylase